MGRRERGVDDRKERLEVRPRENQRESLKSSGGGAYTANRSYGSEDNARVSEYGDDYTQFAHNNW